MVRWRESVLRLKAEGVSRLVELGAGKVLAGLAKRIDKDVEAVAVGQPAEVDVILKTL
jgi:[acyl-carrier-protein] S-malonyltransferase